MPATRSSPSWAAAVTRREQRVAFLGVCAGIRNHELRHLQRRHFERPGWVHVRADSAKGGRERWVPVLPELEPVVGEILASVDATAWDPGGAILDRRVRVPGRGLARSGPQHRADGSQAQARVAPGAPQ